MEVDTTAILVYGYAKEHAEAIKERLDSLTEEDIVLVDGSDKESMVINDILGSGFGFSFKDSETKILMFIGFKGGQIEKCLHFFPRGDIVRPIFCTLTEHNIGWTLEQLLEEHPLLQEQSEAQPGLREGPLLMRAGQSAQEPRIL